MATQQLEPRFIRFQEYISRQGRGNLSAEDSTPRYAHPVDEWILRSLNATPVKAVLDKAIDALVSVQFGQQLATNVSIDQRSFPELYAVLSHCARTLDIPLPHTISEAWGAEFNAYTAGTDDYAFISISAALLKHFSREEAAFVIGHECGHIASGHMIYHTAVWVLTNATLIRFRMFGYLGWLLRMTAGVSLMAWSRRSEFTCDRAGLLCCGDIAIAERALLRLVTGLAEVDQVDIDDYLRRSRDMESYHSSSNYQQFFYTHPMIPKRIEALRLFARSELYYDLSGKPRPAGITLLTRAELDRQVNQFAKP